MELPVRQTPYVVPSYSLTGDILSYLRCGLQYRYNGIGQLPSTRPAQLWFGQFVHGVLEEAYRRFDLARQGQIGGASPPLADAELDDVFELIGRRLGAVGLRPRSHELEVTGRYRARVAVNELGPLLFPLVNQAEVRLSGTRPLRVDLIPAAYRSGPADRYEVTGVVDVITQLELGRDGGNPVVQAITGAVGSRRRGPFEVIVDYKGMRRPPTVGGATTDRSARKLWDVYAWQLQTYALLRSMQLDAQPVAAGVLVYLNELAPTFTDLNEWAQQTKQRRTDVPLPRGLDPQRVARGREVIRVNGSEATYEFPQLPFAVRFARAVRVVAVNPTTVEHGAERFDEVVAHIETSKGAERRSGQARASWPPNPDEEATCAACDFLVECPAKEHAGVKKPPLRWPTD